MSRRAVAERTKALTFVNRLGEESMLLVIVSGGLAGLYSKPGRGGYENTAGGTEGEGEHKDQGVQEKSG